LTVRVTVCPVRYPVVISMNCWVELIGVPLNAVIVSPGLRPPRHAGELRRTVAIWALDGRYDWFTAGVLDPLV
jgi:hypothetical protein